jgi:2-isopropylmalate synthase
VKAVELPVELYDTTLRDGAQRAGLSYTVEDRLRILHRLDEAGFPYVEGGWPGANPRDTEFFQVATREALRHATLSAFGMTRRAGERAEDSQALRDLLDAETEVVCLVGKAWDLHVRAALRTTADEAVRMVADSVGFLASHGRRVFFDAEHFFDGFAADPGFALSVLCAAEESGAERLVLCDTNGGNLPDTIAAVVRDVREQSGVPLGVHVHDDAGCAVASSLAAIRAGVLQVQGTVNGYGERCGNADLVVVAANLALKLGVECLPADSIGRLAELSHYVAEVANVPPDGHQPFVGRHAFTHKAGLHTSAVARLTSAYEHVPPAAVGNRRGVAVSDLGGRSTVELKAREFGVSLDPAATARLVSALKEMEAAGYAFEAADASLELLMRRLDGWRQPFFEVEAFRAHVDGPRGERPLAEATVKVRVRGKRHIATAEGRGPVGALDNALRQALGHDYPELDEVTLTDYRVRVLDGKDGTAATVRVLIDSSDGEKEWTTVGVSEDIIEASWQALTDSLLFGLLHPRVTQSRLSG